MKKEYPNDYGSVTDILGILRKIALEIYFKNNTPEFLAEDSKKNLAIGEQIHSIIQAQIEKEQIEFNTDYPDEIKIALKSFELFKKENPGIKLQKAEMQVINEKYKYNGTLDCLGIENKELILIDWKTGKCNVGKVDKKGNSKEVNKPPIYNEHYYQTTAYVYAYNEQEKADIERARVVVFAKDKISYNTEILTKEFMNEIFNEVFLSALKIYNYKEKHNDGQKQWSGSNGQRTGSNTKGSGGHNNKSTQLPNKLPSNF